MTEIMFSIAPHIDPHLIAVELITFSLIVLWFKRRVLQRKILDLPEDYFSRQLDLLQEQYPYKG